MTPRKSPKPRRRRARRTAGLLLTVLFGGGLAAPTVGADEKPFADLPPQEPGVTLRVFDIQSPLSELCDLKPAQTPNVDKLIPTVDWSSTEGFGFTDNFVSQILGNIDVPADGMYAFRLISDDGSRLFVGDEKVIDHDGLHGAEPKDGAIALTPGHHALRIDHFDRGGGQQVTLQWKPPGADDFTLVPNSVLSTDAGVVRVTAPGRKECEGRYDTPGDGLPLTSVNPGYTLTDLRPEGFEPQVSAMDWMPGGRLAVTTWGGSDQTAGEVYILDNVTGDTGPEKVTYKKIADGLKEPMGIKYVDGKLYVSEKHQLTELSDTKGDNTAGEIRKVAEWPYGGNFHEFAFGLLYEDGNFYLNLSVAINYGGATTDPQPAANRGTTIKVNKKTGKVSYLAGGLRTPNGIGRGPKGELFVTDNQGGWLPASKLLHIKPGRFFNHHTNPDGPFDDRAVTKPVLWLPQNEIANSPSTPMLVKKGSFAGQMLFGDVTYGGIQRADLEKVDGAYQGAVFRHTQGLEAGITRISTGGIVFALLLAAAIILVRLAIPDEPGDVSTSWVTDPSRRRTVKTALNLIPFAGIFFLWFMGAVRARIGEAEDQFFATVFLGSGLLFVATLFGAAAAAGGLLVTADLAGALKLQGSSFGRHVTYSLLTTYAMRMAAVFTFSTSTIGHRLGVLPRWLYLLGYLVALTLLLVSGSVAWSELVFPLWALGVSLHIFVAGLRPRPGPSGAS
ncbi:hypothetical protein SALBM311S_04816 [Streptomyces alboniger]